MMAPLLLAARLLSLALLGLIITTLAVRYARDMRNGVRELSDSESHLTLFRLGLIAFFLAAAYSTVELLFKGVPGGLRNILQVVGLIWVAVAIHWGRLTRVAKRVRGRLRP